MGPRIMGKGNGSEWVVWISFDVKPGGEISSCGLASQYSLTALMRGLGYAGIYNTKARAKKQLFRDMIVQLECSLSLRISRILSSVAHWALIFTFVLSFSFISRVTAVTNFSWQWIYSKGNSDLTDMGIQGYALSMPAS